VQENESIKTNPDEGWYEWRNSDMIQQAKHMTKEHKWYESTTCDLIQAWYESKYSWNGSYWHDLQRSRTERTNYTIQILNRIKGLEKEFCHTKKGVFPNKKNLDTQDIYDTMWNKDCYVL
jgi:intein/homing endonuclease